MLEPRLRSQKRTKIILSNSKPKNIEKVTPRHNPRSFNTKVGFRIIKKSEYNLITVIAFKPKTKGLESNSIYVDQSSNNTIPKSRSRFRPAEKIAGKSGVSARSDTE